VVIGADYRADAVTRRRHAGGEGLEQNAVGEREPDCVDGRVAGRVGNSHLKAIHSAVQQVLDRLVQYDASRIETLNLPYGQQVVVGGSRTIETIQAPNRHGLETDTAPRVGPRDADVHELVAV
jgi:hypothetical protein